ncbi:MAG: TonB-dependent receptor, partial [Bacteroidota bacterium]
DSISLANRGGGFEVLGNEPIASVGRGRTYGAEFLFQQKFSGNFYAVLSYTLYNSEFTGFDRDNFLRSAWDNQHLVSLLGGLKLKNNWEVSGRFRYLGRAPFAPVDQAASLETYPALVQDFRRFGDEELAAFSQLDLRVDKKFSFNNWSLDVFVDVQNVLNAAPADEPRFGLARDDAGNVLNPRSLRQVNLNPEGQVLPTLGLVINI